MEEQLEKTEQVENTNEQDQGIQITEKKYTVLELLQNQLNDYKDLYLRASADYQNLKKQSEKKYASAFFSGQNSMVEVLLPFFDDFDRMIQNEIDYKGIEYVYRELTDILKSNNIEVIEAVEGDAFDESIHDAVMVVPASRPEQDNHVKMTLAKGYKHGDKIIRYATVAVYKYVAE